MVERSDTSDRPSSERFLLRLIHLLALAIGSVPYSVGSRLARGLAWPAYLLSRRLRTRGKANLREAWPERPEAWVRQTTVDAFRHRLVLAYELMRFVRHGLSGLGATVWLDQDRLEAELGQDRGTILVSAHLGNYWLIPLSLAAQRRRPTMLATLEPPTGRFTIRGIFRTYIYLELLPSAGVRLVGTSGGAREPMLEVLRAGGTLFVMADLPVGRVVDGRLLAAQHPLPVGPAEIAAAAEATLLPAFTHRRTDGSHEIAVMPQLRLDDPEAAMRAYLALLERDLEEAPAQWLWFHRHWRAVDRQLAA